MLFRTITLPVHIKHKLKPSPDVVDESCLVEHEHEVVITFKLPVEYDQDGEMVWVDFKYIKQALKKMFQDYSLQGDIGEKDVEMFTLDLVKAMTKEIGVDSQKMAVRVQETSSYGVEWIGNEILVS